MLLHFFLCLFERSNCIALVAMHCDARVQFTRNTVNPNCIYNQSALYQNLIASHFSSEKSTDWVINNNGSTTKISRYVIYLLWICRIIIFNYWAFFHLPSKRHAKNCNNFNLVSKKSTKRKRKKKQQQQTAVEIMICARALLMGFYFQYAGIIITACLMLVFRIG